MSSYPTNQEETRHTMRLLWDENKQLKAEIAELSEKLDALAEHFRRVTGILDKPDSELTWDDRCD